jgi:hypothetical protein
MIKWQTTEKRENLHFGRYMFWFSTIYGLRKGSLKTCLQTLRWNNLLLMKLAIKFCFLQN